MKTRTIHCEDCVEDIPNDEIYWEDERMYCGRCGSELELPAEDADLFDTITSRAAKPLYSPEDEEYDEEDQEEELEPDEDEDDKSGEQPLN